MQGSGIRVAELESRYENVLPEASLLILKRACMLAQVECELKSIQAAR